jgi:tRNA-binding EMAP/Myf-like protein
MVYQVYHKIETFKKQAPMQVVSYLQNHNSEGMKALGISLVGFVMNMIKSRLSRKS